MTHKRFGIVVAALAALALWDCGGGDNLGTDKPIATISVTPPTSTIAPEETVQLQAAIKDADGAILTGRAIAWSSNASAQATVSTTGLVTGVADGSATITATSEGQSGSAVIAVATPTTLSFAAVTAGYSHACGVTTAGVAYCCAAMKARSATEPRTTGRARCSWRAG